MYDKLIWPFDTLFYNCELYAPYNIKNDSDYYNDLENKFNLFKKVCIDSKADNQSITIIDNYCNCILNAIRLYYSGKIGESHNIVKSLVEDCIDDKLALDSVFSSLAFPGSKGAEVQLFRARISKEAIPYKAMDMLHLPFDMRGKVRNDRFSIAGVPSLYLCNSSYCCWLEMGRPSESVFMVSPVLLDGSQRILNLAVMMRDKLGLRDGDPSAVHCWVKLLLLSIATSYRVEEQNRTFKSEYIISQGIMLACGELKIDGVAYYSKRVENECFAIPAVNLAMLATYNAESKHSDICKHIKIGDSFSYALFRQLGDMASSKEYELRYMKTGLITNIGSFEHQYDFRSTEFCRFDKFLFADWNKERIDFGNALLTSHD